MSRNVEESEKSSVSYKEIENEANSYRVYEDFQSALELNEKGGKKNIEKIKKKHRDAILCYESEI